MRLSYSIGACESAGRRRAISSPCHDPACRVQSGRGCERNSLTDLGCSFLSLLHQEAGKTELLLPFPSLGFGLLLVNTLLEPVTLRGGAAGLLSHGVNTSAVLEKKSFVPLAIFCQVDGCPARDGAEVLGHKLGIFQPLDGESVTLAETGGLGLLEKGFQLGQLHPSPPRIGDSNRRIASKKHPSARQFDMLPMCSVMASISKTRVPLRGLGTCDRPVTERHLMIQPGRLVPKPRLCAKIIFLKCDSIDVPAAGVFANAPGRVSWATRIGPGAFLATGHPLAPWQSKPCMARTATSDG